MEIRYSIGDIFCHNVSKMNFLVTDLKTVDLINIYHVLCLNNGRLTSFFTRDIDPNSVRVG